MDPIETGKYSGSSGRGESSSHLRPSAMSSPPSSSSKYKGVRKRKWGKWVSEIRLPNSRERIWLGSYDSAEKAARAFDAALFCLRGRHAKFNFPSSPPDIAGAHNLTQQEIQAVAAQYANEHSDMHEGSGGAHADVASFDEPVTAPGGREDGIDWSFLGALDENERRVSDFGFLYGDIEYMDPQLHHPSTYDNNIRDRDDDNDDDDDGSIGGGSGGGNYIHQSSYLWNF